MKHNPSFLSTFHFYFPLVLLLSLSTLTLSASTTYFVADETTNFCNPERGFYIHSEQKVTSDGQTNLSQSTFAGARKSGNTLLLRLYYFDNFRTKELPQAVLDQISSDFGLFRQNGCKAVLRFAYTNDNDSYPIKDGSPDIWKRHLEQLKPILHDNADVIAVVQAGFLGAWGEWYFSSTGTGEEIKQSVKNDLINELLDAVPASRAIQLRTPDYKRAYLGIKEPLPTSEAFTSTPRARIGHHNDAFLYQADNMGTYSDREVDMAYLAQECLYLPNGGETDVNKESVYKQWATGDKAQAEMAQLHYSYLNQGYCATTIDHWREDGSFDILARNMGYRFQLTQATLPRVQKPNEPLPVNLVIKNVGYASPYNARPAYIVLTNASQTYTLLLQSDPRLWAPNSATTVVDESLILPQGIKEGKYDVALWLPDDDERIAKDARFAIRLANPNMWEESTGYNKLGMQIQISSTTPGPEPEPEPTPSATVEPVTQLKALVENNNVYLTWVNPTDKTEHQPLTVDLSQGVDTASSQAQATVAYQDGVSTITYTTSQSWEWAGANYPVNQLSDIDLISFEYKGDGKAVCAYPYVYDGTCLWRGENGYIDLDQDQWQSYSYAPEIGLWCDPTYSFGQEPVLNIGFVANPNAATSGSFAIRNLKVDFKQQNKSLDLAAVLIVRKEDSAPTGIHDGTTVFYGLADHCEDTHLTRGHTFYYAAYAENKDGQISFPAILSITVDGTALPQVKPYTSTPLLPCTKIIRNGQILLLRDGKIYNAFGQLIQ